MVHILFFNYEYTFAYTPGAHLSVRKWGHVNQDSFQRTKKRKRMGDLLNKSDPPATRTRQSRLSMGAPTLQDDVDDAWGEAFFGLDIQISQPLFRETIVVTKRSKIGFGYLT